MNRTALRETKCRQAVHKLITSLHSESYRLSGMLIHHAIRMRLAASDVLFAVKRRAVEPANKVKILPKQNNSRLS
jgi:hypothetical protein